MSANPAHSPKAADELVVVPEGTRDVPTVDAEGRRRSQLEGVVVTPGVWRADQNVGEMSCRVVNFPTRPFNRDNPDKYRIDPASGEIPFDFTLRDG